MLKFCALLALLFGYCCGHSQTLVKGKVAEASTNVALAGAVIVFTDSLQIKRTILSAKDGSYRIRLSPGFFKMSTSFTGYHELQSNTVVAAQPVLELPVSRLSPAIKSLAAAKVQAQKPFISLGAGRLIMNVGESGLAAGSNAWELLGQAPGVQTTEDGGVTLKGKDVALYIDGRPSNLSGEALKTLLMALQAGRIDKIELISSPSARYDASGAAVILIKTAKLAKPGFNATIIAGAGSSRYVKANSTVDFNYKTARLNFFGGYDIARSANLYQPDYQRISGPGQNIYISETERDYRSRLNQGFRMGADWTITKHASAGILFKGMDNHRSREVNGSAKMGRPELPDSAVYTNTAGKGTNTNAAINLYFKTVLDTAAKKELVLNTDYYNYVTVFRNSFLSQFYTGNQAYRPAEYRKDHSPMKLNIYSISADYSQPVGKGKLEAGIKASFVNTNNDVRWDIGDGILWVPDLLRTNHFVYREHVKAAYNGSFGKWELDAGLRTEVTEVKGQSLTLDTIFNRRYLDWFPTLSLKYQPSKNNEFSLSARRSIYRPAYSYLNPFVIFRGQYNYFQGNPNLMPSYSNTLSLEYGFKSAFFVSLAYTYTVQSIGQFYRQDNATKITTEFYDNFSFRHSAYAEFNYSKQITKKWYASGSVSPGILIARYGTISRGSSSLYCYVNASNSFTIPALKVKLDVSGFYNAPYRNGFYRYNAYGSLNISLTKDVWKKKAMLRLNVLDLLKTNITGNTTLYGGLSNSFVFNWDSRSINFAITYRLGKTTSRRISRKSNIDSETGRIQ